MYTFDVQLHSDQTLTVRAATLLCTLCALRSHPITPKPQIKRLVSLGEVTCALIIRSHQTNRIILITSPVSQQLEMKQQPVGAQIGYTRVQSGAAAPLLDILSKACLLLPMCCQIRSAIVCWWSAIVVCPCERS